jgi:hypothetical protein
MMVQYRHETDPLLINLLEYICLIVRRSWWSERRCKNVTVTDAQACGE